MFTIKVNEFITHIKRFARTDTLLKDFGLIAEMLGDQFGFSLFQLPPSYRYSSRRLRRILRQLDPKNVRQLIRLLKRAAAEQHERVEPKMKVAGGR